MKNVLATLLLHPRRTVSVDSLVTEVWWTHPPRTACATIQTYIYQLRRLLAEIGGSEAAEMLVTDGAGYRIDVADDRLDYTRFENGYQRGKELLRAGRCGEASEVLADALRLWRGKPFADVGLSPLFGSEVIRMEEQRGAALRFRIDADLQNGRDLELIPELRHLVRAEPFDEWLHGRLLTALIRAGRRADALQAYQDARRALRELGLTPSADLETLHIQALKGEIPTTRNEADRVPFTPTLVRSEFAG
ncbi:AfsR/SARP family transcriptional regulator [Amycolatopsis speibonae]|uniref:BTAD domain-containing putative transcriptional regulator n=1 Tax=Amycolatopsis speibonae TaxID=1450224 RepID=A0ABV7P0I4_9PSEU